MMPEVAVTASPVVLVVLVVLVKTPMGRAVPPLLPGMSRRIQAGRRGERWMSY